MSEVRLVVREADHDWSGTVHGSCADRAIAALSADPATLAELEAACARFAKPLPNRPFLANLSPGRCDESYDAGIVIIDLLARMVVVDSAYSTPGPTGTVCYHNGECATDTWLRHHLADDWLWTCDPGPWLAAAEERRRQRTARSLRDARAVFYDRPMLEYIARETFAAFARRMAIGAPQTEESSDSSSANGRGDHLRHSQTDSRGLAVDAARGSGWRLSRDVATERHDHLTWDLQDQCERWSRLEECPPGLDPSSFAFRYGGFGTHELVQYYHLIRELLGSCWQQLVELRKMQPAASGPEVLTVEGFLTSEVPRLESVRDHWLDTPDWECHGRTPRLIIDRERARLPEGMSGQDAIVDPDCPCCQMLADMPGPTFWHLDGSAMDEDFAFNIYHRTREEWEAEQREWEEHGKRFEAEWSERERLGVTDPRCGAPGEASIWASSFSAGETADVPLGARLFGIGVHLAEIITDLRRDAPAASEVQGFIDQLNRNFGNLRELLQTSEPSVAEAIIHPVMDRFVESLAAVASARPDTSAKCESLASSLTKFLDSHPAESTWGSGGLDDPF